MRGDTATAPTIDFPCLPILEACPVGFVIFDPDGAAVHANARAHALCPRILDLLKEAPQILPGRPSSGPGQAGPTDLDTAPGLLLRAERVWTHPAPDARGYLRLAPRQSCPDPACPHLGAVPCQSRATPRMRGDILANVTHEVRTPINAVIGYADLLLDDVCGPLAARQRETVAYLRDAAEGLLRLVNDLLSASRIEAGRSDLILSTFRIDHLIEEVVHSLQPLYAAKGLRLRVDLQDPGEVLRSDRGKCKQILVNLLSNAIKFTSRGEIVIGASAPGPDGEGIAITVRDTGAGIPAGELEAIFEMFHQVDDGAAREHEGSGLGLYLSRRLAGLLGGAITVESEIGAGSAFTLLMPRRLGEAAAIRRVRHGEAHPSIPAGRCADGPLVLLVGSSDDGRRILSSILEAEGMRIREVAGPEEAIAVARTREPSVIVLDIERDPGAGWESYHELKAHPATRATPLVFLTDTTESMENAVRPVLACRAPFDRRNVRKAMRMARLRAEPERLLVVDDEETMCAAVAELLEAEGFKVSQAFTGGEAIRKCVEERPDLVLLDLRLPDISGWDVIRRISGIPELRRTRIVILTGLALTAQEVEDLRRAATGLMTKDQFRVERLIEQIDAVLAPPSGTRADVSFSAQGTPAADLPPRRGREDATAMKGGHDASGADR